METSNNLNKKAFIVLFLMEFSDGLQKKSKLVTETSTIQIGILAELFSSIASLIRTIPSLYESIVWKHL
jgi:hypothetical protein